ncbi:MAG: hypothetical protein K0Q95_2858 [Bacteroidota bacterium]|jgi:hypothetical protein|nr:hypothetical protein [Bacteroidota bacterium]
MKRFSILISFFLLFLLEISAQDSTRTGLLYGFNNAYYLSAPIGWVMDNESGKEEGLTAVFYPKGSSWAEGETVMYSTFINFDSTKNETVADIIKGDSVKFKEHSPGLVISRQKPITIGKKKKVPVMGYSGEKESYYENVAYIPEKKGVVLIIISSHNKNGCINHHKDFEALIKSYRFLTDKVNIK